MKKVIFTILFALLAACGTEKHTVHRLPGEQGPTGPTGPTGPQGPTGTIGKDGESPTVTDDKEGTTITDSKGNSSWIPKPKPRGNLTICAWEGFNVGWVQDTGPFDEMLTKYFGHMFKKVGSCCDYMSQDPVQQNTSTYIGLSGEGCNND